MHMYTQLGCCWCHVLLMKKLPLPLPLSSLSVSLPVLLLPLPACHFCLSLTPFTPSGLSPPDCPSPPPPPPKACLVPQVLTVSLVLMLAVSQEAYALCS